MSAHIFSPKLSASELKYRSDLVRPVVEFNEELWFIKPCHISAQAYTWYPEPSERAPDLTLVGRIQTYHTFAYQGFFKPTIAEVLCQIPDRLLRRVKAFEILKKPEWAADLNAQREATNQGFHVATTQLYTF